MVDISKRVFIDANQKVVEYDGSPIKWRVSAYLIILNEANQILLIKNRLEELFDIVGGGIEFGETIEEALAREAMEEAGAVVQIEKLLHSEVGWFYHRKDGFHQTMQLFYTGKLTQPLVPPTDPDSEKVFWADLNKLEDYPLPTPVIRAIQKIL